MRLRGFYAIFRRDLLNLLLSPILVSVNTIFPLLLVLVLGYIGSGIYAGGEVSSYDYYGITMIFMVLNVSITAANSFMERSIRPSNLRILYAPLPGSYIYLSKIAATFVFTTACLCLIAGVLAVCGIGIGGANMGYVLLLLIGFNLFSCSLGILFCCIFKSEELANKLLSIINNVSALAGGLFFPWDGLGKVAETISGLSPVKWVAEGVFRIIYDYDLGILLPTLAICLAGSLVLAWGCKLSFRAEDYV